MPIPVVADGSIGPSLFITTRTASQIGSRVSQGLAMLNFTTRGNVVLLTAVNAGKFTQNTLRYLTAYLCQVSSQ